MEPNELAPTKQDTMDSQKDNQMRNQNMPGKKKPKKGKSNKQTNDFREALNASAGDNRHNKSRNSGSGSDHSK